MRILCAAIAATLVLGSGASVAGDLVIHAGELLDGVTSKPQPRMSILVHDERIVAVQAGFAAPDGAEVIDLSDATVMPGFIDCHVHISARLPDRSNATEQWLKHGDLDRAFDAAVFVRQMLQQGFTSARDVGGGNETVAIRNAINDGKVPGPRLWVSLEPLGRRPDMATRAMGSTKTYPTPAGRTASWTMRRRHDCACASTNAVAPT
jgi:imidazolonepropionase-like amidohydrolase